MRKKTDPNIHIGEEFDRLTIIAFDHQDSRYQFYYLCRCDCGNTKIVSRAYLVDGVTRSCGCLRKELARESLIDIKGESAMTNWGFLRETTEIAEKAGIDKDTGVCRTGLDKYLSVIFPKTTDWIHDKAIGILPDGTKSRKRPDYRSESLKLIIEVDGVPHYDNPETIRNDIESTKMYERAGYKVVRIPYFIQLSNKAVKTLFGVEVKEDLFDDSVPSMGIQGKNTPAFMCQHGVKRMAEEFKKFPEQYITNLNALKSLDDFLSGASLLENEYNNLEEV